MQPTYKQVYLLCVSVRRALKVQESASASEKK